jgi:hypothetical protein
MEEVDFDQFTPTVRTSFASTIYLTRLTSGR